MINVLFVCIGNSCRSQMAEGFAHKYGTDVMHSASAGLAPASIVQPMTIDVMSQKNIDIQEQFPKNLFEFDLNTFQLIVNMSGVPIPVETSAEIVTWQVVDPMAQPEKVYLDVRDRIEALVMQLILELRRSVKKAPAPVAPSPARTAAPTIPAAPANTAKPDAGPQRFGFGRIRRARD